MNSAGENRNRVIRIAARNRKRKSLGPTVGKKLELSDMIRHSSLLTRHWPDDRGLSLIETMVAVLIALFAVFSLGAIIFTASVTGKNQGSEATRATIYAQDKMEKLLSLGAQTQTPLNPPDFTSCTKPASSQPSQCNTTGISGGSWTTGLLAGGSISATTPSCSSVTPGYADFLDANGMQLTGGGCSGLANVAYILQWQITDLVPPAGAPAMKQITVAVFALSAENPVGGQPIIVLTSVLSNPN